MKYILIIITTLLSAGCIEISKKQLIKDEEEKFIKLSPRIVREIALREPPKASIHRSARQGEIEYIIQHIKAGTDVNEINNSNGQIALHYAAIHNHNEIIKILIDSGSNIDARDNLDMTPLHLAALGGHKKIVKILINSGALINPINLHGNTPIDLAIKQFEIDSLKTKSYKKETGNLLRQKGGKTSEELKEEQI